MSVSLSVKKQKKINSKIKIHSVIKTLTIFLKNLHLVNAFFFNFCFNLFFFIFIKTKHVIMKKTILKIKTFLLLAVLSVSTTNVFSQSTSLISACGDFTSAPVLGHMFLLQPLLQMERQVNQLKHLQ